MNIDPRTLTAVDDLWTHTVADPDAGLATLFDAHAVRRRRSRVGLAVAAAVAVAVAWWGGSTLGPDRSTTPEPAHRNACPGVLVTCLGHRTYRFDLTSPVEWRIPPAYGVDSGAGASSSMVESYGFHRNDGAGVTVMEGVRAASRAGHHSAADVVPATAAGFTSWLASRPYFSATTPRRVVLDGRPAWHVRVRLRGSATGAPDSCLQGSRRCRAVTSRPEVTGVWGDMVADYTAFDLPGAGTTVVWSWAFGGPGGLAHNRAVVAGLSFPPS